MALDVSGVTSDAWDPAWDLCVVKMLTENLVICRRAVSRGGYHSALHRHTGVGIVYCIEGHGLYTFGAHALPFTPGRLIYFDSQIPHRVQMHGSYTRWDVCFRPGDLGALANDPDIGAAISAVMPCQGSAALFEVPPPVGERIQRVLTDLESEVRAGPNRSPAMVRLRLAELHLLLHGLRRSHIAAVANHEVAAELLAFIEERLSAQITVAELARRFHYSPSHVYRVIRRATGKTPTAYIRERKLDLARRLLVSTDLAISDIARAVGVPNVSHFCRIFREGTGQSPGRYRSEKRPAGS